MPELAGSQIAALKTGVLSSEKEVTCSCPGQQEHWPSLREPITGFPRTMSRQVRDSLSFSRKSHLSSLPV